MYDAVQLADLLNVKGVSTVLLQKRRSTSLLAHHSRGAISGDGHQVEKIEASRSEAVEGRVAHDLASSSAMKWHQLEELFHDGEGRSHSSDEDNKLRSVLEVGALIESDGKELQGSAGLGQSRTHIASHVLSPAGDGAGRQAQSSHLLSLSWTNSVDCREDTVLDVLTIREGLHVASNDARNLVPSSGDRFLCSFQSRFLGKRRGLLVETLFQMRSTSQPRFAIHGSIL